MKLLDRFIKYCQIETTSLDDMNSVPSSQTQWKLVHLLAEELKELGLQDIVVSENCYVYAKLNANKKAKNKLGLIAHVDTSNAVMADAVKPVIHQYKGGDIHLSDGRCITLSQNPELNNYIGHTIVTSDGNSVLGCDDKGGIAIIMTALQYLKEHPEVLHGELRVCFTPDEEVGRGTDYFDLKQFDADIAYTIDGETLGEIEYENFNAAVAKIEITGASYHPGYSKGKMVNAILILNELLGMLPKNEIPSMTEKYEGFFHVNNMEGICEKATAQIIIRDHDDDKFIQRKQLVTDAVAKLNVKYNNVIKLDLKDNYYNMSKIIKNGNFHLVETAKQAMLNCNVTPKIVPIRGGTDGARLSYMGLPCPNLSTSGHNFHSRNEYVSVDNMEKMVEVILEIIKIYSK